MSAQESSQDSSSRHSNGEMPDNFSLHDKDNHGDTVDARAQNALQGVHLMDVADAHEAEGGEHQNAYAGPKIAAINRHQKLEDYNRSLHSPRRKRVGLSDTREPNDG